MCFTCWLCEKRVKYHRGTCKFLKIKLKSVPEYKGRYWWYSVLKLEVLECLYIRGHEKQKCVRCGYFFKPSFIFLGCGVLVEVLFSHPSVAAGVKSAGWVSDFGTMRNYSAVARQAVTVMKALCLEEGVRTWAGSLEEWGPEGMGPVGRHSIRTRGSNSQRQVCSHCWRTFSATREKRILRVRKLRTFRGFKECLEDSSEVRRKGSRWSRKPSHLYTMNSATNQHMMGESKLTGVSI